MQGNNSFPGRPVVPASSIDKSRIWKKTEVSLSGLGRPEASALFLTDRCLRIFERGCQ
jgi:hypothetical protein